MIQIENLSHSIAGQPILKEVSLELPKGGITALIGPNGAGKSTLLNLMARQLPLQTGRIQVDGLDLAATSSNTLSKTMALVSQHVGVASRLRVAELVRFGRWPHAKGRLTQKDHEAVEAALEAFDLQSMRDRFLDALSGGQRQRAFVAMAVAQETDWLLLDEPLNNLDMYHAHSLMQVLHRLARDKDKSIVIVIHDINQACAWADHVVALQNGAPVYQGAPDKVVTPQTLEDLYGIRPQVIDINGQTTIVTSR
ncbi:MAG: ATP-binding cassette domain-containing protein [Thalassovita sp.]